MSRLFLLLALASPLAHASDRAGAVIGTITGFGIGHAIQGRWSQDNNGWVFTGGEILALGTFAVAGIFTLGIASGDTGESAEPYAVVAVGAGLTYLGLRVWEIMDLWNPNLGAALVPTSDGARVAASWKF